jgi:RHS repeat-associated protein
VYTYDNLARVSEAIYRNGGSLGSGTLQRQYDYQYDVAGNRTQQIVNIGGSTTTNYTYNVANQISSAGTHSFTYDNAGHLTNDGVSSYTWDRANRLLSVGTTSYLYNGLGQRVQQTVSGTATNYLVDMQPGLAQVLSATTGANTTRYVFGLGGLHEVYTSGSAYLWSLADGLGNVRGVVNSTPTVQETRLYSPFGEPTQTSGSSQTVYGFTGEETDSVNLVYLRARYYNPTIGQFFSLDPLEGASCTPMSLNRYMYVQGKVVNGVVGEPCDGSHTNH